MILRWTLATATLLATSIAFAQSGSAPATAPAASAPAPLTAADKNNLSYAIGFQIGNDFVERKMDIDINTVIKALQDGYAKRPPTVPEATMRDVLGRMQQKMMTEAKSEFDKAAATNKAASAKFMSDNRNKKGIVALPSGVQYRVIEDGSGKSPTATSEVTVHYRGSLASGLEFDSSFARGEPVHVKVDSVIKGWQEVLPKMKIGDHWQVFVPPEDAYGDRGQPPRIGPNEALVFEIKLLDVK